MPLQTSNADLSFEDTNPNVQFPNSAQIYILLSVRFFVSKKKINFHHLPSSIYEITKRNFSFANFRIHFEQQFTGKKNRRD